MKVVNAMSPDAGLPDIDVCSDNADMGCKKTDADGNAIFRGVADDLHFILTVKAEDESIYPGSWNVHTQGEDIELFTPTFSEMILGALSGGALDTSKGQLFVSIQDDNNVGVAGASVSLDPAAENSATLYIGNNNMPDANLTETVSGTAAVMNIPEGAFDLVVQHGEKTCTAPNGLRAADSGNVNFDSRAGYATYVFANCN